MAKAKMTKCKSCGTEISGVGKVVCPKCGRVNKPPFYKSAWFIILCVVFLIIIIKTASAPSDTATDNATVITSENTKITETEPALEPIEVTVDEIVQALNENALKAASTYKDSYVKLTGRLNNIDSDGSYFSLGILSDDFSFDTVLCKIKEGHLDTVMNFTKDQKVTVIGTITSVGEVMGYTLRVESIQQKFTIKQAKRHTRKPVSKRIGFKIFNV